MLFCMRTTVEIRDELFAELKHLAAESHSTLRELIEDAIRLKLARRKGRMPAGELQRVITFRGRGVQAGVNLDSMDELLDIMESIVALLEDAQAPAAVAS